jgi:hypothetical protein
MESAQSLVLANAAILVPVAFAVLVIAFILVLARSARLSRDLERYRERAEEDRLSGSAMAEDLKESIRSLQQESRELSELNFKLPSLMKQLTVDLDRRSLGPLILKVVRQIFTPSQALVFFADEKEERLTLAASHGLEEGPLHPGAQISVGDGRIGFAARKRISMGGRDFRLESNINREQIQRTEPVGVRADICAPLVGNGRLLGAMSMGLPRGHASIEAKRLFGMIADVASLALASSVSVPPDPAARELRSADRDLEQGLLHEQGSPGPSRGGGLPPPGGGDHLRRRSLQELQRHPRASGR